MEHVFESLRHKVGHRVDALCFLLSSNTLRCVIEFGTNSTPYRAYLAWRSTVATSRKRFHNDNERYLPVTSAAVVAARGVATTSPRSSVAHLDAHPRASDASAVQSANRVLGITRVVELDEREAGRVARYPNVAERSILGEGAFDVDLREQQSGDYASNSSAITGGKRACRGSTRQSKKRAHRSGVHRIALALTFDAPSLKLPMYTLQSRAQSL